MAAVPPVNQLHAIADRTGALGSMLCALHCALLPFVLAFLPGLGIGLLGSPAFEAGFTVIASLLGGGSLLAGWRRHRRPDALRVLLPGLALLWLGAFVPVIHHQTLAHALSMAIGGGLIAGAHWRNLRLQRRLS